MIEAYWISPEGQIHEVPRKHINYLCQNYIIFGFTKNEIEFIYKKHGEKIGIEGKARTDLLLYALRADWIRIRYRPRENFWTIELWELTKFQLEYIKNWFEQINNQPDIQKLNFFNVNIHELYPYPNDSICTKYDFEQFMSLLC